MFFNCYLYLDSSEMKGSDRYTITITRIITNGLKSETCHTESPDSITHFILSTHADYP